MAKQLNVNVSFGKTASEATAKLADEGQIVFVDSAVDGGVGTIYVDGKQYGGGGGDGAKLPSGSSSNKKEWIPAGTDLSGMTAMDIIKMMLFATYLPKYTAASAKLTKTYTVKKTNGDAVTSDYVIPGTASNPLELKVEATFTITGYRASCIASPKGDGTDTADLKIAYGGNISAPISVDGVNKTATSNSITLTFSGVNAKTLSISSLGEQPTDAFITSFGMVSFGKGADFVKDSAGVNTRKTAEEYNVETASDNTQIDTDYKIKAFSDVTIIDSVTGGAAGAQKKIIKAYLPIYFPNYIKDGSLEFLGSTVPSGTAKSEHEETVNAMVPGQSSVANAIAVSAENSYKCETVGGYFVAEFPKADVGQNKRWQMLLPEGFGFTENYVAGADGVNLAQSSDPIFFKTNTTYTIHDHTYCLWESKQGETMEKQRLGFKISQQQD